MQRTPNLNRWAAKWSDAGVQFFEPLLQPPNLSPESPGYELLLLPEAVSSVHDARELIEVVPHGLDFILKKPVLS